MGSDPPQAQSNEAPGDVTPAILEEQLLLAAAAGDVDELARLIELEADVDYQDEEGVSPLMMAAEGGHTAVLAALLSAGAPWNAQDKNGYCAGEYAMGSNQQEAVDLLLDFAVQAELVLGALQRRMQVGAPSGAPNSEYLSQKLVYRGEQLLDADGEAVMMGWERPLMLRHAEVICPGASEAVQRESQPQSEPEEDASQPQRRPDQEPPQGVQQAQTVPERQPQQQPRQEEPLVLAPEPRAVVEANVAAAAAIAAGAGGAQEESRQEEQQQQQTEGRQQQQQQTAKEGQDAQAAAPVVAQRRNGRGGGRVLNIGFGMGIVDAAIQSHHPDRHTIVEAHPDVYDHMVRQGWADKPGVRILNGRWQDVLPELLAEAPYDGIFFDTYGEYYEEMREFHTHVPHLLARDGVYSFFNGLASDNIFFHMVYCRLISLELAAKGLTVEYEPVAIGSLGDDVWQGVRSKYWHFETYFLPRVTHDQPLEVVPESEAEGLQGDDDACTPRTPRTPKAEERAAQEVEGQEVEGRGQAEGQEQGRH